MTNIDRALVLEALRESNAIENVWDEKSLADALAAWDYAIAQKRLTPAVVCETHRILMRRQPLEPHQKGAFRQCRVFIGGREGIDWPKVSAHVQRWCEATMTPNPDWQALHIAYERSHPFVDGNGRTGRIFMNWTRVKHCRLPPLVIYERKKWEYYEWFR